jgi:hypothetical protein
LAQPVDFGYPHDLSATADLAAVTDFSQPSDLAGPIDQAGPPPDGFFCRIDTDCRLFSSYCSTAACVCEPLPAGAPDPVCMGTPVTCLVDPCDGKSARCSAGTCTVM